ncbi:hypothetical protein [Natrialba asiatica]|uniref:Uncharacterized protein n=1 Tax=Natrialba asiatica (strain ATCC 700177 / DSM 12278 / JCM 9576 / FERM P-10747 / NBRC 102637 / 172P1) TaxID=29540 RepID=M0AYF9_NATA1|nr:hypothetical protein [Natrialba asiatica]ELZ02459.1 hypothetical protein C481_07311 [Natrialba asiatica DSM 12278]
MSRRRGPRSDSSDRNQRRLRQLGAAFVLLVGLSGGMMALQGDASLLTAGVVILGCLVAGSVLLWYLHWIVR